MKHLVAIAAAVGVVGGCFGSGGAGQNPSAEPELKLVCDDLLSENSWEEMGFPGGGLPDEFIEDGYEFSCGTSYRNQVDGQFAIDSSWPFLRVDLPRLDQSGFSSIVSFAMGGPTYQVVGVGSTDALLTTGSATIPVECAGNPDVGDFWLDIGSIQSGRRNDGFVSSEDLEYRGAMLAAGIEAANDLVDRWGCGSDPLVAPAELPPHPVPNAVEGASGLCGLADPTLIPAPASGIRHTVESITGGVAEACQVWDIDKPQEPGENLSLIATFVVARGVIAETVQGREDDLYRGTGLDHTCGGEPVHYHLTGFGEFVDDSPDGDLFTALTSAAAERDGCPLP
ncbi:MULTISPECIES: hypothetical protein [Actinoalloteichus]|uniref:hypothetical protein n=1 Tax=Actinoalloteichus TaxID=65496 RepID=UPI0012F9EB9E|nr:MULTISPECIES: hypothetical protein [Actinoalloteichus]